MKKKKKKLKIKLNEKCLLLYSNQPDPKKKKKNTLHITVIIRLNSKNVNFQNFVINFCPSEAQILWTK